MACQIFGLVKSPESRSSSSSSFQCDPLFRSQLSCQSALATQCGNNAPAPERRRCCVKILQCHHLWEPIQKLVYHASSLSLSLSLSQNSTNHYLRTSFVSVLKQSINQTIEQIKHTLHVSAKVQERVWLPLTMAHI